MSEPIKFDYDVPMPKVGGRLNVLPETVAARECPIGASFLARRSKRTSIDHVIHRRGLRTRVLALDGETMRVWVIERPTENGSKK